MSSPLKIGTRSSKLALWQAEFTRAELARVGVESELVVINERDEMAQNLSSDNLGGKDFFIKEIEAALLRGEVDLTVYSMKNLPTTQPEGLVITAVSHRDNPSDWLIVRKESFSGKEIFKLKHGATVGASSTLRKAQLLDFRPDTQPNAVRGDAATRLEKLRAGDFDAVFLAAADLSRLGLDWTGFEVVELNPREFVPAPAQGVLAWLTHRDDTQTRLIMKKIHRPEISSLTNVERRVLQLMKGGCQLPLGAYCERDTLGNFHAFAACEIDATMRRARWSSSTSFGMAEKLVEQLKN